MTCKRMALLPKRSEKVNHSFNSYLIKTYNKTETMPENDMSISYDEVTY